MINVPTECVPEKGQIQWKCALDHFARKAITDFTECESLVVVRLLGVAAGGPTRVTQDRLEHCVTERLDGEGTVGAEKFQEVATQCVQDIADSNLP